jgi:hypothetical protein
MILVEFCGILIDTQFYLFIFHWVKIAFCFKLMAMDMISWKIQNWYEFLF